jgi:transposase, IS5 family
MASYSFHAIEVECIGKGKASAPYDRRQGFDHHQQHPRARRCVRAPRQGAARQSLSRPHLALAIEDIERLTGGAIERAYVDKGYRGHDAPKAQLCLGRGATRFPTGNCR